MKNCPACGAANSDSFKFCLTCGARLTDDAPAEQPAAYTPSYEPYTQSEYSQPVYTAPAAPVPENKTRSILNEVMASKSVLNAAILSTLSIVLSVISAAFSKYIFMSVMGSASRLISRLYAEGVIPFSNINDILREAGISPAQFSEITNAGGFSVSFDLTAILILAALWITWASARKGNVSKAGFVICRVLAIIALVASIFFGVVITGTCIALAVYGFQNLDPEILFYAGKPIIAAVGFIALVFFVEIFINACYSRTFGSLSKACSGVNNGKISVIAAAALIFSGVRTIIFAFFGLAFAGVISPLLTVGSAGTILSGAAYILFGYILIKAKVLLAKA